MARARAISLVAVGALAGGVAVASTAPWSREATHQQPDVGPGGPSGATGNGPGVLPVPPATETPATPAAAPAAAPATETPAPAVWRAGPGAFMATSWNTVGAPPPQVDDDEVAFRLTGRGQRSELEPALPTVRDGDQHDLTFSVRLDGTFAESPGARQVITRWENDSPGQAPLDLRVRDGELLLHGGEGHPSGPRTFTRTLGRAPVGEWTQLRVLVRFSADPDKGSVSVWRDGRPVLDDVHPRGGTLYPGQQSYLKVGLHRDRTIAAPSTVRFAGWQIDHGRATADTDRGSPAQDATSTARASTERADAGHVRSSDTSDERSAERSIRDEPARHTSIRRPSSADNRSGHEESADRGRSGTSPPRTSRASSRDDSDRADPDRDDSDRDDSDRDDSDRDNSDRDDSDRDDSDRDDSDRDDSDRADPDRDDSDRDDPDRADPDRDDSDRADSDRDDAPRTRTPAGTSSDSRSAPDGATGQHRETPRDASEDADTHRDTSREGSSNDDAGNESRERSEER